MSKMAEARSVPHLNQLTTAHFPFFYVIRTKAGRENEAAQNIYQQATKDHPIQVYNPIESVRCPNGHNRWKNRFKPLFSRYIFAGFELERWYLSLSNTRHVTGIVRFSNQFATIQSELFNPIIALTSEGLVVRKPREIAPEFNFAVDEIVRVIGGVWDGREFTVRGFQVDTVKADDGALTRIPMLRLESPGPFGNSIKLEWPERAVVLV